MEQEQQCAHFVFNKVGAHHDNSLPYQPQLIFSQLLLGGLFVRSYRMMFKNKNQLCLTFAKRRRQETHYLFFKFVDSKIQKATCYADIKKCTDHVRRIKQIAEDAVFNYRVMIAYLDTKNQVEMSNEHFQKLLQDPSNEQYSQIAISLEGKDKSSDKLDKSEQIAQIQCQDVIGGHELQQIKAFVWAYLDTFGQKYKDNLYNQFNKKTHSLDLQRIIATVNWIIYCQTVGRQLNQLQSSNWTCFQAQSKQKCKSDRKQIVLTGCGSILYIPLLFICQKLQNYKREFQRQLYEVMQQSKKYYSQGQIKAYVITDQIDQYGLLYRTNSACLHHFPEYERKVQ